MFPKPWTLGSRLAAGLLIAFGLLISPADLLAKQQSSAESRETYQPGSFSFPYYGGGGGGYGGYGGFGMGWGMGGWGVGSTAGGSILTGMGNAIRAQGQYNLDTSAAAINMTEAQRREMENSKLWTQTYFEKRRINQAYRDSQRRPPGNSETWMRLAQAGAPARLSASALDPVTGRINWPAGLLSDAFQTERAQLDQAFADRALAHGAIGPQAHAQISSAIGQMVTTLKSLINDYSTNQYLESRNFLTSLSHEASLPGSSSTVLR